MVDEKSTGKNRPFFTYIILCICSGFMLASIAVNGWKIEAFSVNPMIGPSAETLTVMGAKDSYMIVQEKEVWRLLSAMVLHAGFVHFVLNMAALYFVGSAIEFSHGFVLCMIMFVVPAIGGSIFSAIFLPSMISVGASGGIFGLIGACLADIFMNWGLLFNEFVNGKNKYRHIYVLLVLLVDVIINCLIGLTPFVDNFTRESRKFMLYRHLCSHPI
jgi:membrane associated rhomboid family serine protease